jgi:DNA polymerase-3 subunit alpha
MFIHIRTHSHYSLLRATPSPTGLVQIAQRYELPSLGLCDYEMLSGAIEFYQACKEAGIVPLIGLELKVTLPSRLQPPSGNKTTSQPLEGKLAFYAMNMSGWRSLCRLSSAMLTVPDHLTNGYLPFDTIAQESEGLLCLVCGEHPPLEQWLRQHQHRPAMEYLQRLEESFPKRLYVEIQRLAGSSLGSSDQRISLARRMHLPLVAGHPVYFLHPEQAQLQKLVTAIRLNKRLAELPESELAPVGAYFVPPAELEARFKDLPEAVHATEEITQRCRLVLPLHEPHFPQLSLPSGQPPFEVLRQKAFSGARRIYGNITSNIEQRLNHELQVIEDKRFTSLFLIMEEIISFARQADIPTASRGSASSSLVAHCLGITTPDPLRLDLYFERFLNPARTSPPDFDTDLCSQRRDEVIQHVYHVYGAQRVAMVGTINHFRARSALREVAKAHGISPAEISSLCNVIPYWGWSPSRRDGKKVSPYQELALRYKDPLHQQLFQDALALSKTPHHLSIHAGGVVIAPGELTDLTPVMQASKGIFITQFDLESVEALGLVKLDLLGIRGLSVLGEVAKGLSDKQVIPGAKTRLAVLEAIPNNDTATSETIRNGCTIGCFQIESPGMRATLREIQASSVDDVMVALSLYRPGPLSGGLKDAFVRRHLGKEPVTHLHPALQDLLKDTYGVILYQEQVLRIAHELGGLNLAEADLLRRAMSHFDPGKQMQTLKEKFLQGAQQLHHVPAETGERIWELMAAFAGYGFPKAHAASYAQVAWRGAWCKTHHPAEFMAAVLANWGGYYSQRVYLMECRRLGLTVRPPHINYSQPEFSVSYQDSQPILYMGLDQVSDLTRRTQRNIIQQRPFDSLEDFLLRAKPRSQEADNLVSVGALHGFGNIPTLLLALKTNRLPRGQMALFTPVVSEPQTSQANDWTPAEKAARQEAILGLSVNIHPLELFAQQIEQQQVISTNEAILHPGKRLRVAGIRQVWQRMPGTSGDFSMSLEDLEGVLEVIVPTRLYSQQHLAFTGRQPLVVEGILEINPESGEALLRAERAWQIA